jgi:hypothetical protein
VSGTHTAKWYGYVPPVALLDAASGENVTFAWLDWRRDYLIVVYAGQDFEFMASVLEAPPPASQLFQPPAGVWAPAILEAPVEVTPSYLVYSMPYTPGTSAPGSLAMTLAAGILRRSDTTYSRPRQFSLAFGYAPTVSFTDGWSTDSEGEGGAPAWFGASGSNASITMAVTAPPTVVMRNANASTWQAGGKFYVGDGLPQQQRLPGGLPLLAWNYTSNATLGNSLLLTLNLTGVPPGQYPITIADGLLVDYSPNPASVLGSPTLYGNIRTTAWLKVGPTPVWRVLDSSSGEDCTGEPLNPLRPVALAFSLSASPPLITAMAAQLASAAAGLPYASLPTWGALAAPGTAAAIPLPPQQTPAQVLTAAGGTSLALLFSLAPAAPLLPGNYTPVSSWATGAVCNGLPGRELVCSAHEALPLAPALVVGACPSVALYNGAGVNWYGGALDWSGLRPLSAADTPIPALASSLSLRFSGAPIPDSLPPSAAGAYAWAAAVAAPPGLPPQTLPPWLGECSPTPGWL